MAKELPYFRFYASEWLEGDITLEDMAAQGLFTNICAWYWKRDCEISLEFINKRLINGNQLLSKCLTSLINAGIIGVNSENLLTIDFLEEQHHLLSSISVKRSKAGRKGGKASAKQMVKQTSSYKDKDKDKDKYKAFIDLFNELSKRAFRGSDKVASQFNARLKDGYTMDDFRTAITNAVKEDYLKKNPKYLTPEYITRANILDKWLNVKQSVKKTVNMNAYPTQEELDNWNERWK